jgi:hypothetical protein
MSEFIVGLATLALEALTDRTENGASDLRTDEKGALFVRLRGLLSGAPAAVVAGQRAEQKIDPATGAPWTRDVAAQPATGWKAITKDDAGTLAGYRALRFDAAGVVKVTVLDPDGSTTHDLVRHVAAGEVWPAACVTRVWSTGTDAAVVVDGWS